jgi:uncharacterized protein YecE (DUF72 family)
MEFRHASWFSPEVYDIVDEAGWTICIADSFNTPEKVPVLGRFCYIRRHGTTARYASCYSDEQLRQDAAFVTKAADGGRDVYVYFNNDAEAHAIRNALTLRDLIDPVYLYRGGVLPTVASANRPFFS